MHPANENDPRNFGNIEGDQTSYSKRKIEQVDSSPDSSFDSDLEKTSEKTKLFKREDEAANITQPKAEAKVCSHSENTEVSKKRLLDSGGEEEIPGSEPEETFEKTKLFKREDEAAKITQLKAGAKICSLRENTESEKERLIDSGVEEKISDSDGSTDKSESECSKSNSDKTVVKDVNGAMNKPNGGSETVKPLFKFGSTLNDPKYSWLGNFGKNPLGSNVPSLNPLKNDTASMLHGFKTSANINLADQDAKVVDFDTLLTKAKDTEQSKPDPIMPQLQHVEAISTGEEDEITLFETTGKLHVLGEDMRWVERGVGQLKINGLSSNLLSRRIIMRLESVHKVILNVKVVPDLKPTAEGKFVRFSAFETEGTPSSFTFRTTSSDIAEYMVEEMSMH